MHWYKGFGYRVITLDWTIGVTSKCSIGSTGTVLKCLGYDITEEAAVTCHLSNEASLLQKLVQMYFTLFVEVVIDLIFLT